VDVKPPAFLTWVEDADLVVCCTLWALYIWEESHSTHWIGDWVCPRAALDKKILWKHGL